MEREMKTRNYLMFATLAVTAAIAAPALAATFDDGIPASWQCQGSCGTLGANGAVGLAAAFPFPNPDSTPCCWQDSSC